MKKVHDGSWLARVCMVGNIGVGRQCLINRLHSGSYKEVAMHRSGVPTLDFALVKWLPASSSEYHTTLQFWDCREDRFRQRRVGVRGAAAILICCSVTDLASIETLSRWQSYAMARSNPGLVIAVLCKADLVGSSERQQLSELVREHYDGLFMFVSAKTGENVDVLVEALAKIIQLRRVYLLEAEKVIGNQQPVKGAKRSGLKKITSLFKKGKAKDKRGRTPAECLSPNFQLALEAMNCGADGWKTREEYVHMGSIGCLRAEQQLQFSPANTIRVAHVHSDPSKDTSGFRRHLNSVERVHTYGGFSPYSNARQFDAVFSAPNLRYFECGSMVFDLEERSLNLGLWSVEHCLGTWKAVRGAVMDARLKFFLAHCPVDRDTKYIFEIDTLVGNAKTLEKITCTMASFMTALKKVASFPRLHTLVFTELGEGAILPCPDLPMLSSIRWITGNRSKCGPYQFASEEMDVIKRMQHIATGQYGTPTPIFYSQLADVMKLGHLKTIDIGISALKLQSKVDIAPVVRALVHCHQLVILRLAHGNMCSCSLKDWSSVYQWVLNSKTLEEIQFQMAVLETSFIEQLMDKLKQQSCRIRIMDIGALEVKSFLEESISDAVSICYHGWSIDKHRRFLPKFRRRVFTMLCIHRFYWKNVLPLPLLMIILGYL